MEVGFHAFFLLFFLLFFRASTEKNKRLLLTDPDVLNSRMTKLERTVETVLSEKAQLENKVSVLELTVSNLQKQSSTGTAYTIWGKQACPTQTNDTDTIYSGYVAGSIYSEGPGSPDLLCLTSEAELDSTTGEDYGRVYGAEYNSDTFKAHADGQDMPCAVCQKQRVSTTLMIPGRKSCYKGWTKEYSGSLASGYHAHTHGLKYICIASDPDFLVGGESNTNQGPLLGPVVAKCGTLRCPPYHENFEIPCVVCSK